MKPIALAVAACLASLSCVPLLPTPCTVAGTDITFIVDGEDDVCPPPCFTDADGDGYGAGFVEVDEGGCDGVPGLTALSGDCDDADDNRFPTNPEVCDGLDNDCLPVYDPDDPDDFDAEGVDGLPSFDVEGEEELDPGSYVYSCTPTQPPPPEAEDDVAQDEIRFFLRGGSEVNGQRVDARDFEAEITAGRPITGTLKIRVIVGQNASENAESAVALSWASPHADGFASLFGPDDLEPGIYDLPEIDLTALELTAPDYIDGEVSDNLYQLVLAGSSHLGTAEHVASLTGRKYCCGPQEPTCECDPVWGDEWEPFRPPDGPPQGPSDVIRPPLDLADMDALDLAACRSYGAARVPVLGSSIGPDNTGCDLLDDEPCVPLTETFQIGCAFLSLLVEEEEGVSR